MVQCGGGAACFIDVLSAGGTCILWFDEGQECHFDGLVQCKFGHILVGGVCAGWP